MEHKSAGTKMKKTSSQVGTKKEHKTKSKPHDTSKHDNGSKKQLKRPSSDSNGQSKPQKEHDAHGSKRLKTADFNERPKSSHQSHLHSKPATSGPTSRLDKYKKKLEGAKFRLLNESLYTGEKSLSGLSKQEFEVYHEGFASQVSKWPVNPVDVVIRLLKGSKRRLEVGDFGCGDAKVAAALADIHEVHSFDLVAANPSVIASDIARDGVPLPDKSLDFVIFSLSLMGEEVSSYIREAWRTLKKGGRMWIAEVKSRFVLGEDETSKNEMERGIDKFIEGVEQLGFRLLRKDIDTNIMFSVLEFSKTDAKLPGGPSPGRIKINLKACEYKRR